MPKKLSQMTIKDWVEAVGLFFLLCGFIYFFVGIGLKSFGDQAQANNFAALRTYWKTGLQLEIFGIVILILSGVIPSKGGK